MRAHRKLSKKGTDASVASLRAKTGLSLFLRASSKCANAYVLPLVALVVVLMACAAAGASDTIHDFKKVWQGEKLRHTFVLSNDSAKPLKLNRVRSSCVCVSVEDHPSEIPAQQSGKITLSVDTAPLDGRFVFSVTVMTDSAKKPIVQLKLVGDVRSALTVNPKRVVIAGARFGQETKEQVVRLVPAEGTKVDVLGIRSKSPHIEARLLEVSGLEAWDLIVKLRPDCPVGNLRTEVIVDIEHEKQKTVSVPVNAVVKSDVEVLPGVVSFGGITDKDEATRYEKALILRSFSKGDLKIEDIKVTPAGYLKVSFEERSKKEYTIKLVLTKVPPSGEFKGQMEIRTNSVGQPKISVPVRAFVE